MEGFTFLFWFSTFFSIFIVSTAFDSIASNGTIADGETIVSAGGDFELGFFEPVNSRRYLGIWYKKSATGTVVWVANRDSPLSDTSGVLQLSEQGSLVLSSGSGNLIWSSNTSNEGAKNPKARLLDSGNFIITDGGENNTTLWQSFDYMGDSLLPGMKLGKDLITGLERHLLSWKSASDPSTGDYTYNLDVQGYPQIMVRKGSVVQARLGPWNGLGFSGSHLNPNSVYTYEVVLTEEEIYYKYELLNTSVVSRLLIDPLGDPERLIWVDQTRQWRTLYTLEIDTCDKYAVCGTYGICNIDKAPACGCLRGFEPKVPSQWGLGEWSNGCIRKTELSCGVGDRFLKIPRVKLPDTSKSFYNTTMNLEACEEMCTKNCSCTAYANQDIRGKGSGCLLWFDELMDIREFSDKNGQDLYIRIDASDLGSKSNSFEKKGVRIIVTPVLIGIFILGLAYFLHARMKRKVKKVKEQELQNQEKGTADDANQENLDLPLFDFTVIADATNYFSNNNKIGEGGYGPVYRGKLKDGQEIAVKRLSKMSKQGLVEFKNEVVLIAKLQHRNLVKLLGCCIQEEEKILIYEYLPNKSLDNFIFDQSPSTAMNWSLRYHIISGIARGLLYLHQDSRLRIIHRDLKASNILLDSEMNPKISDFGLAKGFKGDESEAKTRRVVGTYGYMSPEYIIDGAFSVKSDVFSFGVMLLEIISGRSNRRFNHPDHDLNLLGHAWKLVHEGRSKELIEASIIESCNEPQVLRFIQVGLLCVQKNPEDRPNMGIAVLMLSSDMALPQPKKPGFFTERQLVGEGSSSSTKIIYNSLNQMTVTAPSPR